MLNIYVIPIKKENRAGGYCIFFTSLLQRSFFEKYIKSLIQVCSQKHTAIRDWIQKYKPKRLFYRETKIAEYIIDETQLKVGSEYIWLWVAIEPETKNIIAINISKERNMFVSEIISGLSKHPNKIAYPGLVDLEKYNLKPKGKSWEV